MIGEPAMNMNNAAVISAPPVRNVM